jgi:hypothetical protein
VGLGVNAEQAEAIVAAATRDRSFMVTVYLELFEDGSSGAFVGTCGTGS